MEGSLSNTLWQLHVKTDEEPNNKTYSKWFGRNGKKFSAERQLSQKLNHQCFGATI